MSTATKPKKEAQTKPTQVNPKYRVIPNLSLKGKDIMTRIKNRSLIPDRSGQIYSLDDKIDTSRKMSKLDLLNEMQKNDRQISDLKSKLKSNG